MKEHQQIPTSITIYNRKDCCNDRMAKCNLTILLSGNIVSTQKLNADMSQTYKINALGIITI